MEGAYIGKVSGAAGNALRDRRPDRVCVTSPFSVSISTGG